MNQRICVRAIIKKDNKVLFLRRSDGRPAVIGKYQLPGGRVHYGVEPQVALYNYVKDTTGLDIQISQLKSVVSYVDHQNRDLHYLYLVYLVGVKNNKRVRLSQRYDHYEWEPLDETFPSQLTEATKRILNISQHNQGGRMSIRSNVDKNATLQEAAIIYSDGGSRGNPGPSAAGYVIMNEHERIIYEGGAYLGVTTNNIAEYQGVKVALEKALILGVKNIDFRVDSLLVANQMKGLYRVKNRELWPLHERIKELVTQFERVRFTHVRREFNQQADAVVNRILDERREASQSKV